jgi:hypothetical protein
MSPGCVTGKGELVKVTVVRYVSTVKTRLLIHMLRLHTLSGILVTVDMIR